MRVYKFLPAKWARDAILNRRLKISLLSTLNDPWDGNGLIFDNDSQILRWEYIRGQSSQSFGITCFSSNWCDPVLWSHYADQHHGIVLGFDVDEKFAVNVEYRDELIDFDEYFGLTSEKEKTEFFSRVIATKYTNWKYEEEVRLFTKLISPDPQSGHFMKKFDQYLILRSVIFGARYSNHEEMAFILSMIRDDTSIDCWRAKLGDRTFQMRVDPNWKQFRDG